MLKDLIKKGEIIKDDDYMCEDIFKPPCVYDPFDENWEKKKIKCEGKECTFYKKNGVDKYKLVVSRKTYECFDCKKEIKKGTECLNYFGCTNDPFGEFFRFNEHLCSKCGSKRLKNIGRSKNVVI